MVSKSDPRLPLQIEDASRPETDEVSRLVVTYSIPMIFTPLLMFVKNNVGKLIGCQPFYD